MRQGIKIVWMVFVVGLISSCTAINSSMNNGATGGAEIAAQQKLYGSQPASPENPMGAKYPGRVYYTMCYPEAKPVFYGGESLSNYYDLAKQNQQKIIEDEKYKYFFHYSKDGNTLNSCQFDKSTFENTQNLLKDKTGLMEPVFKLKEGSFDIAVDETATKEIYKKLSKSMKLKPVLASLKYGKLFQEHINKETARRAKVCEERAKDALKKGVTTGGKEVTTYSMSIGEAFNEINKIADKSEDPAGNEFKTIYNIKFKEIIEDALFSGVDYLVIINKDNYVIDKLPNYMNQKHYEEYYLKEQFKNNKNQVGQSTQMQTVKEYFNYKCSVEATIEGLEQGYIYSNVSLNIVGLEKLKTLSDTGRIFTPDAKITTTNISLLDKMLSSNFYITMANKASEAEKQCYDTGASGLSLSGQLYKQACWDRLGQTCDKLWVLNYSKMYAKSNEALKYYDNAISILEEVKAELKLTSGLKGSKLK